MRLTAALITSCAVFPAFGQVPAKDLLKPPPDAREYVLVSSTAQHGHTSVWTTADGARCSRESINMRGFITETDQCARMGVSNTIDSLTIRGFTPSGDESETFSNAGGTAHWHSPVDSGNAAASGTAVYVPYGGTYDATALLFDQLMAAPTHRVPLYPSGYAALEKLGETTLGSGASQRHLVLYNIAGLSFEPTPVWADAQGRFFGIVDMFLSMLPKADASAMPHLLQAQSAALAQRAPALLQRVLQPAEGPVAFTHVEMFDADAGIFRQDMTVTVADGRIAAVGPAAAGPPLHARLIDGRGKTLLPGLWEMHQHYGGDARGPLLLSLGVTSVRDPGNNNAATLDRARRRSAGQLLAPHVYPSSLIDGISPYTAQAGTAVASQDEALATVRRAKADGFTAIKIYSSFNPAWVAATAAEAHRLGLHVHGHVPVGMRTLDAVNDGYDEITHINYVLLQAMPDSLVNSHDLAGRLLMYGRLSAAVDLNAEPIKSLLQTLASRHIAVDPTLVTYEGLYVPDPGEVSPAYAPFIGTLPPNVERGFRSGGLAVPAGSSRAQFRASFEKMKALAGLLHAHGVLLVAGTDGIGLELVHELELYEQAGLTPVEALETATLNAARLVGAEARTGSIHVGKEADLVLVDGDPSLHIGDLRHTKLVMLGGRLMDADALRKEAGFNGAPR